jgi:hypothetical protein
VNESAQRKVFIDMIDTIVLKNVPTKDAVAQARGGRAEAA